MAELCPDPTSPKLPSWIAHVPHQGTMQNNRQPPWDQRQDSFMIQLSPLSFPRTTYLHPEPNHVANTG